MTAQAMGDAAKAIQQIDDELKRGWRGLPFPAPIEDRFLAEYLKSRSRMVPLWAALGTIFYLLAILGDLSMVPDVSPMIVSLRLGVFLPFAILVILIMQRWPSATAYDALSFMTGLLGISLPMLSLMISNSEHLFIYQTGSVSTLAFFAIVLRPRFPTLVCGLALMLMVQLLTTKLNGTFDAVEYGGISTVYCTLCVFLGMSAFFAEQVDRQNFLNHLRGELLQGELRNLTERDPLTGLYNRLVLKRLQGQWDDPVEKPRSMALIMLDIDHFKLFNDVHGHIEGDECIRRVSELVAAAVAEDGVACRYGGEEFLLLLPDCEIGHAHQVAESIRSAIAAANIPHRGLSAEQTVTASLGVTAGFTDQKSLKDLLLQADNALYAAKKAGRNQVCENVEDSLPLLGALYHS